MANDPQEAIFTYQNFQVALCRIAAQLLVTAEKQPEVVAYHLKTVAAELQLAAFVPEPKYSCRRSL